MKVILVGTAYPLRGGIAHYIGLLWKYLSHSHDVEVVTFKRQYPRLFFPGTSQEESGSPGIIIKSHVWIDSINPFNWIRTGWRIRAMKPDLLLFKFWMPFFAPCYAFLAVIARWRTSTRVMFIDDNVIPHERRLGDRFLTRLAFRFVDGHIVQSEAVRRDLARWAPHARWTLLPHPIYEIFGEEMERAQARAKLQAMHPDITLSEKEKVILFFGYVRRYKGLHHLLEAMPDIRQAVRVRLLVVGEFYGDEQRYRDQAADAGLSESVLFHSRYVPNEEVALFFSAADLLVLPYVSATQSGIIQIAYNFNRPVVATDVGGLAEVVIDGKTGYIVPPEKRSALVEAVSRFFNEMQFEPFRANVMEERRKYSWQYMAEGIERFYRELG